AQLTRLGGSDFPIRHQNSVSTPIDGDHHAGFGFGVVWPIFGAWPVASTPRTVERLIVLAPPAGIGHGRIASPAAAWTESLIIFVQSCSNSGMVLLVQPMSSKTTSGTSRPSSAPAWAIR